MANNGNGDEGIGFWGWMAIAIVVCIILIALTSGEDDSSDLVTTTEVVDKTESADVVKTEEDKVEEAKAVNEATGKPADAAKPPPKPVPVVLTQKEAEDVRVKAAEKQSAGHKEATQNAIAKENEGKAKLEDKLGVIRFISAGVRDKDGKIINKTHRLVLNKAPKDIPNLVKGNILYINDTRIGEVLKFWGGAGVYPNQAVVDLPFDSVKDYGHRRADPKNTLVFKKE